MKEVHYENLIADFIEKKYLTNYNSFRANYIQYLAENHIRGISRFLNTFVSYFSRNIKTSS
jgi:hypothetical protein